MESNAEPDARQVSEQLDFDGGWNGLPCRIRGLRRKSPKGQPGEKGCPACQQVKPISAFREHKSGLYSYCFECSTRKWKAANERSKIRYAESDGPRTRQAHRMRKKNYGISSDEYHRMLCEQVGCCKACDDPFDNSIHGMHVDHCHTTGGVRALLCRRCNLAIGLAKDSPERLRMMADYIEAMRQVGTLQPAGQPEAADAGNDGNHSGPDQPCQDLFGRHFRR